MLRAVRKAVLEINVADEQVEDILDDSSSIFMKDILMEYYKHI